MTPSPAAPPLSPTQMLDLLSAWQSRGWLRPLDLALVRFLAAEVPSASAGLLLATALVSHQLGRGHVCLDLAATLADPYMALSLPPEQDDSPQAQALPLPAQVLSQWSLDSWLADLHCPDLVASAPGPECCNSPLVLAGRRLYLRRYWRHERLVENAILTRLEGHGGAPSPSLRRALDALFPPQADAPTDWQKIACALATRSRFAVITGGPGTGKTTTVVRLLALLQAEALQQSAAAPLEIRLAAPTGKAAARLQESIASAIAKLPPLGSSGQSMAPYIPHEVTTLHRLLGPQAHSRQFRHNARNPLPLDVLVVDEGSMVDLEMMAALLQALPTTARFILLGDKDQLASVEAGSVLGELCCRATGGYFHPDTVAWIAAATGEHVAPSLIDPEGQALDQHIIMLRESRRFHAGSGIGQLAAAVNAGVPARIHGVWQQNHADLQHHALSQLDDPRLETLLLGPRQTAQPQTSSAAQGLAHYLDLLRHEHPALDADSNTFAHWARRVLQAHGRFQLLCALRRGPYGVEGLNQRLEALLHRHGLINASTPWYAGRPVLVTRNDYALGLMNGDIGITLNRPVPNLHTGALEWAPRVAFSPSDGSPGIHWVLPSRLQAVETVYALTVHKSQGSEFEHCALLLPPERNPVLTRELAYTGITRARTWFSLISIGNPDSLEQTAQRQVQRSGGLFTANLQAPEAQA